MDNDGSESVVLFVPQSRSSGDWTEDQEELAWHSACQLQKMLYKNTRAHKDVHRTNVCKGYSPIKDVTIYVRATHKVEGQGVHCRQWCFSAYDGSKSFYFAAKSQLEIQTAFGIFRSTVERRLHPGVGGRLSSSVILWTTVR